MIQFNLLPDIKIAFIKAQRLKRIVMVVASGVTAVSVLILIVFLTVTQLQSKHIANLDKDVKGLRSGLESTPDLNKILTIQNQLNNLTALHEKKPYVSRLTDFLPQITLVQVKYAKIELNIAESVIKFTGSSDSLKTTNQFIDTLKFTNFQLEGEADKAAFSDVVLTTFGRDERGASFEITIKFDPSIFDNTKKITIKVPVGVTTRSVTEKPGSLFAPLNDPDKQKEGQ